MDAASDAASGRLVALAQATGLGRGRRDALTWSETGPTTRQFHIKPLAERVYPLRWAHAFATSRSTRGSVIEATKLIAPAASTRAPAAVS